MNDIQLRKSGDSTYDWVFDRDDLVEVIGAEQTRNTVRHAVSLHNNELSFFPYINKGSSLDKYWKRDNLEQLVPLIAEEVKLTCKEIENIEDAIVDVQVEDRNVIVTEISVIRTDGVEVDIYAT